MQEAPTTDGHYVRSHLQFLPDIYIYNCSSVSVTHRLNDAAQHDIAPRSRPH